MEGTPLAAPSPASARRQPILTLRMQEIAQELQQHKAATPRAAGAAVPRAAPPEALLRCMGFCRFVCTCAAGACASLAPPTLAIAEAICVTLIYLLAVPNAVPTRTGRLHYTFPGSAEDVVALSLLRCIAVAAAQVLGSGARFQRPYLLTAAALASLSLPLGLMKLVALRHSQWAHRQWPPFIAVYCLHMAFAVAHVLAAQRFVDWARSRWEHGLGGWGFPWQEGEDAWMVLGHLQSQTEAEEGQGPASSAGRRDADVPAEQLADPDSRWAESGGLRVHYKLALPLGHHSSSSSSSSSTGVVLVHSFGGGAFSWRHIQQPLADACGLPVLAFDRPGFGLTERPVAEAGAVSDGGPYSLKSQALLTLQLSATLGLRQVVLVGHGDGALLALMSAAIACRELALPPPSPLPPSSAQLALARATGDAPAGSAPVSVTAAGAAGSEATDAVPMHRRPAGHHARRGSLPDSLDLAWFSSGPESHSVLQRLLRGDWPASIDPHAGSEGGGSLINGWAAARPTGRRSPLRQQYSAGRRSMGTDPLLLEPFLEEEAGGAEEPVPGLYSQQQQQQQQQGGTGEPPASDSTAQLVAQAAGGTSSTEPSAALLAAQHSVYTNASYVAGSDRSSATQEAGLLNAGGLIDNPSYLSGSSVRSSLEQPVGSSAATEPAAQESSFVNPSFVSGSSSARSSLEQPGGSRTATEPAVAQQSSFVNPSFVSGSGGGSSDEAEGRGLPAQESSLLRSQVLDNPSFVSETSDAEAACAAQLLPALAEQGEWEAAGASTAPASTQAAAGLHCSQQQFAQPPEVQQIGGRSREPTGTTTGLAAQASGSVGSETGALWTMPEPVGLVLLHPDLSGHTAPKYMRVLAQSRLGRRVLRRLLRHEVGEVSNRRAWADPARLTPDLLALYRRPLRVEGWDMALVGVARARSAIRSLERAQLLAAVADAGLPLLVATGEHDHIVPPAAVSRVAERLGAAAPRLAVLPGCGHISHEERPAVLLDFLAAFVSEAVMS